MKTSPDECFRLIKEELSNSTLFQYNNLIPECFQVTNKNECSPSCLGNLYVYIYILPKSVKSRVPEISIKFLTHVRTQFTTGLPSVPCCFPRVPKATPCLQSIVQALTSSLNFLSDDPSQLLLTLYGKFLIIFQMSNSNIFSSS